MHVGQEIEEQLQGYYSNEDLLVEKAEDFGFSDEQIRKLKIVIRAATIRMKSSDLARFYEQSFLTKMIVTQEKSIKNLLSRM